MNEETSVQNQRPPLWEKLKSQVKRVCRVRLSHIVITTLLVVLVIEVSMATWEWMTHKWFAGGLTLELKVCKELILKQFIDKPVTDPECGYWYFLPLKIISYTAMSSIILMAVVSLHLAIRARCKKMLLAKVEEVAEDSAYKQYLSQVFIGALSITALPSGVSLFIGSFYGGTVMQLMSGMEVYIGFAGVSLAYLAFLGAHQEEEGIDEDTENIPKPKGDMENSSFSSKVLDSAPPQNDLHENVLESSPPQSNLQGNVTTQ